MSDPKVIRTVVVTNPAGLHTRAATDIAKVVRSSSSKVILSKDYNHADATDVLAIVALLALCGSQVTMEATGPDAQQVLTAVGRFFGDYEEAERSNSGETGED